LETDSIKKSTVACRTDTGRGRCSGLSCDSPRSHFAPRIQATLEIVTLFEEGSYRRLVSNYLLALLASHAIQLSRTRSEWQENSWNEYSMKGCKRAPPGVDKASTVGT